MNSSNRSLFVVVHALAFLLFSGFTLLVFVIGQAYFANSFPNWKHFWLVAYLPLAPFIARRGWQNFSPHRLVDWLFVLAPAIWLIPIYVVGGLLIWLERL